jgi:hypothetical protein
MLCTPRPIQDANEDPAGVAIPPLNVVDPTGR